MIGDQDNFTRVEKFQEFAGEFPEPKRMEYFDGGVDHFFFGREELVCDLITDWLRQEGFVPK